MIENAALPAVRDIGVDAFEVGIGQFGVEVVEGSVDAPSVGSVWLENTRRYGDEHTRIS